MVLPEHHPQRAVVPAVDVHNHLGRWHRGDWTVPSVPELVRTMDECNVATIVNLDGCWGERARGEPRALRPRLPRPVPHLLPRRLVAVRDSDDWGTSFAASLRDSAARGAGGIKLWKDVGLRVRDRNGDLVLLDDPRVEPLWEALADTRTPVLVHTADPAAFFRPVDERNERLEQLLDRPDWQFSRRRVPFPGAIAGRARDRRVADHPT